MTQPKPRNLVLCFDGTSRIFDAMNSNIPTLYSLLERDPEKQLNYYQTGIGAYQPTYNWSRLLIRSVATVLDQAFATSLDVHVKGGYRFLVDNYREGDKIYLFGFSRGAYTARALAGMLESVGLLYPGNHEMIDQAFRVYNWDQKKNFSVGVTVPQEFKRSLSRHVFVEFVGVWDTVSSVGVLIPRSFPFANGSNYIRYFRHALALDEHRVKFKPQLWTRPEKDLLQVQAADKDVEEFLVKKRKAKQLHRQRIEKVRLEEIEKERKKGNANGHGSGKTSFLQGSMGNTLKSSIIKEPTPAETDVKEVWFVGAHSDVGGSALLHEGCRVPRLGHISLRWMIREAFEAGLLFEEVALERSPLYGGGDGINGAEDMRFMRRMDSMREPSEDDAAMLQEWLSPRKNPHNEPEKTVILIQLGAKQFPRQPREALAQRTNSLGYMRSYHSVWHDTKGLWNKFYGLLWAWTFTSWWWVVECLPLSHTTIDETTLKVRSTYVPNFWRGRQLPKDNVAFHESVRTRLNARKERFFPDYSEVSGGYKHKARFAKGQTEPNEWVS